jgi:hypothetical protein
MPKPHHIHIHRKANTFGPPTPQPARAVVVTIDAAQRSGIAFYVCGKLHWYAEVKALDGPARRRVLQDAATVAAVRGLPLAGVIEVPFGGRTSAALSLTATVALWRDSWRGVGPAAHLLEYTASEWRRALFGKAGMPRAEARRMEAHIAAEAARRDMPATRHYTIGPDAAAAICIGQVAVRSSALSQALGLPTQTDRRHTV